jgi:PAS domain S-box-containing protein
MAARVNRDFIIMKERILKIMERLSRPRADDPDLAMREYMTKVVLIVLSAISILVSFLAFLGWSLDIIPLDTFFILLIMTFFFITGWWSAHRGCWRTSGLIPPAVLIATAAYGNYIGGIDAPAMLLYVLAIVMVAILRGNREHFIALALSVIIFVSMGMAHKWDFLKQLRSSEDAFTNRMAITITVMVAFTFILDFLMLQYSKTFRKARREIVERKSMEEALRYSERQYRQLVENANSIIILMNNRGEILFWNSFAERFFGYSIDEIIGRNVIGTIVPERDSQGADLRSMVDRLLSAPDGHRSNENENMKKDGSRVWISWANKALLDDEGSQVGLLCIGNDITEHRKLEMERRKLQEQLFLSQKLEAVGLLAGGVAHDFNNMLGVIIGYTELVMSGMEAGDPRRDDVEKILDAARRSAALTRKLLAFARKETAVPEQLDLNGSVDSMLGVLRPLIGEHIELVWSPYADRCFITIDRSQLEQILTNLCVNARDAIGETGRITIETSRVDMIGERAGSGPEEYVTLTISDNGCGMDGDTLSHLFEPFFTTKEAGKGTGLGMSTVYGIVKQNGGFIDVRSEPGSWTVIRIFFQHFTGKTRETAVAPEEKLSAGRGETLLVVEDEPVLLKMTCKMLERLGYSVIPAGTPGEAIDLARERPEILLMITDVVMPEMNGRLLVERISEMRPDMKFLYVSGYASDMLFRKDLTEKEINFIHKPFRIRDIALKIRAILDGPSSLQY